jgi:hypothetical protein
MLPTEVRWTGIKTQVEGSGFVGCDAVLFGECFCGMWCCVVWWVVLWDVMLCCLVSGFVGCDAVLFSEWFLTFWRIHLPSSSKVISPRRIYSLWTDYPSKCWQPV